MAALLSERDAAKHKMESLQTALASLKDDHERLKASCSAVLTSTFSRLVAHASCVFLTVGAPGCFWEVRLADGSPLLWWQGADAALKAAKQGVAARDEKLRAMQRQLEAARGELEAARKAAAKAAPPRLKAVKEEEEYVDESPRVSYFARILNLILPVPSTLYQSCFPSAKERECCVTVVSSMIIIAPAEIFFPSKYYSPACVIHLFTCRSWRHSDL